MGKRGPKPQPTVLKIDRGNPGKRALNADEPVLEPVDVLEAPKGLCAAAKAEWERLAGELTAKGVLSVGDVQTFKNYCNLVAEVDELEKVARKVGIENAVSLGYANQLNKRRAQLKQFAETLGLTPSARSGVKAVRKPVTDAEKKHRRFFGAGNAS